MSPSPVNTSTEPASVAAVSNGNATASSTQVPENNQSDSFAPPSNNSQQNQQSSTIAPNGGAGSVANANPAGQSDGVTPSFVGSLKLDYEPNPFEHSFGSTASVGQGNPSLNRNPSLSNIPSGVPPAFARTLLPPVSSIASPDILSGAPGIASPLGYPAWSAFTRGTMHNPLSPAIYDATLRPDYLNNPSDASAAARFSSGTGFTPGVNEPFRSLLTPTGAGFPAPSPGTANLLGFHTFDSQFPDQYRFTPRDGKPPVVNGTNGDQSDYFGANAAVHGLCLLSQVPDQQQKLQQPISSENDQAASTTANNLLKQTQQQTFPDSIRPSFTQNTNPQAVTGTMNPQASRTQQQPMYFMGSQQFNGMPSVYGDTVNPADPSLTLRQTTDFSGQNAENGSTNLPQKTSNSDMPTANSMPVKLENGTDYSTSQEPSSNANNQSSPTSSINGKASSESANGTSYSKGSSRRNSKNETDEEKRKSFLERNRQAALKCRQRKKQWLSNLQAKVEFYGNENEILSAQVSALREEIVSLKTLLIAHKDCPVAKSNSAAVATSVIGSGDLAQRINLGY